MVLFWPWHFMPGTKEEVRERIFYSNDQYPVEDLLVQEGEFVVPWVSY